MKRETKLLGLGVAVLLAAGLPAFGQSQYIGYVYPAGGQQGTTFPAKVGGQRLNYVDNVIVSGKGVSARVVEAYRNMNNQEMRLIREQMKELRRRGTTVSSEMVEMMSSMEVPDAIGPDDVVEDQPIKNPRKKPAKSGPTTETDLAKQKLVERIQTRLAADQRQPACRSISELVFIEVSVAPDAKPGRRELRLVTKQGVSNPLPFYIGQVPETARKPMAISRVQVLGKESLAQRKRPPEEEEMRITLPCTMNGQVASGEVNRYRFKAQKGQGLVVSVKARQLIPYIADAVPGWFQPVLTLTDAEGNELAYNDDYRFKPDPTLFFEVPGDGEYLLEIHDALYRGREDFVYRITVGELPFVTGIFPLGAQEGRLGKIEMDGWNLDKATLLAPPRDATSGTYLLAAQSDVMTSNFVPFAVGTLPECMEEESNDGPEQAQQVKLPIVVNGRIDRPDDRDVFEIEGHAGDAVVAEVYARRLDSPVDSFLKLMDADGAVLAFDDDHQDGASGLNTHHADSYLMVKLPADGRYFIQMSDTERKGGLDCAYRLRISEPRPDFELRVVPSRLSIRRKKSAAVTVYALRKDGFDGPIKLSLENLPKGFRASKATIAANEDSARLGVSTTLYETERPIDLTVVGRAEIDGRATAHEAVPAEDTMQAFLWRHLVPADNLLALVCDPSYRPPHTRERPAVPGEEKIGGPGAKAKFGKGQVVGRMRQIDRLYQEWYLTDEFANRKIAELNAAF